MSQPTSDQLALRIYECGLLGQKEIEATLQAAGGRGRASFDEFVSTLLQQEKLTNWQIARITEGHRRGYFYGQWQVLYLIGAGTFARVYRAVHQDTGEIKAVKVLRSRYSADLETREQFLREAGMVMKLRHPNIVPIQEVAEERERIYMVMDFVEGQNLRDYAGVHGRLEVLTALKIIRDIAAGLAYAANYNITHRDMKLSNVLLSAKGLARIVDFGLATVGGGDDPDEKGGPRSIDYAGLERITGVRRDDSRSDIYFVGCMLYQLVSGQPPLSETRERIKRLSAGRFKDVLPVTQHVPGLPHRVVILIDHLMSLDANKRTQTPALAVLEIDSVIKAIERGDAEEFDVEMTEQQAQEYAAKVSEKEEGLGHTLLLIESNVKLQDMLRERLKNLGYRVLITNDPLRGLSRFEDLDPSDDLPADCVLFGCVGLRKKGVQAFAGFVESAETQRVPAILLVPTDLKKYLDPKWQGGNRVLLPVPVNIKKLRAALRKLLKLDEASSVPLPKAEPGPIVVNKTDGGDTDLDD